MLKENSVILFQGDSITDTGRSRENDKELGRGYPFVVNNILQAVMPEKNIRVINRGISGNRTIDLVERWQEDCIDIKPDYLSILIGVNDTWRRYDRNDPTSTEDYAQRYEKIIKDALENTDAEIILLNTFLLNTGCGANMREDLEEKQPVIKALAEKYNLKFVDLDKVFAEKCKAVAPETYSGDGVHPSDIGHTVIAFEWLKAMGVEIK